ncbi:MAG: hypothetical protein ACK5LF_21350 [Bacteroides xylanisolvens]
MNIYDLSGSVKAKYVIGDDAIYCIDLMSEHYIEFSFELPNDKAFNIGDYIIYDGNKYYITEEVETEEINIYKYKYTLHFDFEAMLGKKIEFYYLNQGLKESEWKLADKASSFIQIVADNYNRYFGITDYKIGIIEPTDVRFIEFDSGTKVLDALNKIAEVYECEWYISGRVINMVYKLSEGSEIDFESEVSVLEMDASNNNAEGKITRLLALGSDRNIPANYRGTTSGEGVDAIYQKRLRIPLSKGDIIDAKENMSPEEVVEGTVIFEENYPKRVGKIESVSTVEYTETNEDTGEKTKWKAFRITDSGIVFKQEYILSGKELRMMFVSGPLNGMDFAVRFNPLNKPETDAGAQVYEIIRAEDYGIPLPNDTLKPNEGDEYVLYGFDISLVGTQYVPAAEQELYEAALDWLSEHHKDIQVYECPTIVQYFYDNKLDLQIGKNVRLINRKFKEGYRNSRIIGFEKKLINKYDAVYKVGDNAEVKRISAVENEVKKQQEVIESNTNQSLQNRKNAIRNTQNLRALKGLIFDPDGYFDPTHIKPNSIETMYLAVGVKSQDFTTSGISIKTYKDGEDFRVSLSAGYINHRSLWWGPETDAPEDVTKYTWRVTKDFNQILQDNTATYYMYVKAERLSDVAEWYVSPEQVMSDDDPNYYYFLMGVIYPVKEDRRDISLTNGMAYISGGTIYGDTIKSINYTEDDTNEGSKYDLNNGSIRIGNKIKGLLFDAANKVFKLFGITLEFRNGDDEIVTKIDEDGSASFAKGNVVFEKNGDVRISGAIINSYSFHDYSNMTSGPWNVRVNLTSFNHYFTFKMGYAPTLILPNDMKYAGATATFVGGFMVSGHPIIQEKGYTFNSDGTARVYVEGGTIVRFISVPQMYEDACQWILIDKIVIGSIMP